MISSTHQGIAICAIDAFSEVPLGGNGATVVLLDKPACTNWMQDLARELAQSETAFLWHNKQQWCLRWFTPSCEVPLCGHASIAAGLALYQWGKIDLGEEYFFSTSSGNLRIEVHSAKLASLDLPTTGLTSRIQEPWMAELLGTSLLNQWSSGLAYGVLLMSANFPLGKLDPHNSVWRNGPEKAWLVMQAAETPHHYQLRFFAPGLGISEDPVTGSAHALVAPWWCEQLNLSQVSGWQPSQRPGGMLCIPQKNSQIRIKGSGTLLWKGELPWISTNSDGEAWEK